jgi:hypothetical protein
VSQSGSSLSRQTCSFEDLGLVEYRSFFGRGDQAIAPSLMFKKQFSVNYFNRLRDLKPVTLKTASDLWPNTKLLSGGLKDLTSVGQEEVIVVGTLIRPYVNRPSMIKDISKNYGVMTGKAPIHLLDPLEGVHSFLSPEDHIMLEDPSYRVRLVGQGDWLKLCTGYVIAVKGRMLPPQGDAVVSGIFEVVDFTLPGAWVPRPLGRAEGGAKYVLFMSG